MPLMDGFQSTRLIRELEHLTGQRMGIIGISSTATSEECFAVGMDNFLSKPLNKKNAKGCSLALDRGKSGIKRINQSLISHSR